MPKRIMKGKVVSNKSSKTLVVLVGRSFTHPVLKKTIRKTKKYHVHNEKGSYENGDMVMIQECSPKSKLKRWEVVN